MAIWASASPGATLLDGASANGRVRGFSQNGSVIVGRVHIGSNTKAFRWTAGGGFQQIPDLAGMSSFNASEARGVSADGSIVVGEAEVSFPEAFRWTAESGTVGLGLLPGGTYSSAFAISADGSTIVGRGNQNTGSGFQQYGFRWTQGGGLQNLGWLPGGNSSEVEAVSADGSVIVGRCFVSGTSHAVVWTEAGGMVKVVDLLGDAAPSNWVLQAATGVSADGKTIVGWGRNALNQPEGWVVNLPKAATATMGFTFTGGNLVVEWPSDLTGAILESVTELTATWTTAEDVTPVIVGDKFKVTVPTTEPVRFFRLRLP